VTAGVALRFVEGVAELGDALFEQTYRYLSEESYWSRGIPRETLARAFNHSLCLVATRGDTLVGFARVLTDRATYAYLCDVFVVKDAQKQGLAQAMMRAIDAHEQLQGLRRWMLMTRDAHELYAKFGFTPLADATRAMERHQADVYATPAKRDQPSGV